MSTLLMDRVGSSEMSLDICQIVRRHTLADAFRVTAMTMSDLTKVFFLFLNEKTLLTYPLTYLLRGAQSFLRS